MPAFPQRRLKKVPFDLRLFPQKLNIQYNQKVSKKKNFVEALKIQIRPTANRFSFRSKFIMLNRSFFLFSCGFVLFFFGGLTQHKKSQPFTVVHQHDKANKKKEHGLNETTKTPKKAVLLIVTENMNSLACGFVLFFFGSGNTATRLYINVIEKSIKNGFFWLSHRVGHFDEPKKNKTRQTTINGTAFFWFLITRILVGSGNKKQSIPKTVFVLIQIAWQTIYFS
jgi:hypothetical protein